MNKNEPVTFFCHGGHIERRQKRGHSVTSKKAGHNERDAKQIEISL